MELKQYQIVLVNLDPTIGSEIKKTRPCLIISPNVMNRHLKTIVVAPMTTNLRELPSRFTVVHNNKKGKVAIDQIRAIDKSRIISLLGKLTTSEVHKCKKIILETFVA